MSSTSSPCCCCACGASPSSPYSDAMSPLNLSPAQSDHKGDDIQRWRLNGLYRRIITPTPYIRLQTWQSQRAALKQELVELGATQDASDPRRIVQLKQQDLRRVELQIRELEKAIEEYLSLRAQAD